MEFQEKFLNFGHYDENDLDIRMGFYCQEIS